MSTECYDRRPDQPRDPIKIAGELVRRGDKLSIEAANCIKRFVQQSRRTPVTDRIVPLSDLSLFVRPRNILHHYGLAYVHQLVALTADELMQFDGMGEKWLSHVRERLAANRFRLKGDE